MRAIHPSLASAALRLSEPDIPVNLAKAAKQHEAMRAALESVGVVVNELPSDDLADSVFIEDTAVTLGGRALITTPGSISRRPETTAVHAELSLPGVLGSQNVGSMALIDPTARMDGGDVLFTGRSLLVIFKSISIFESLLSYPK